MDDIKAPNPRNTTPGAPVVGDTSPPQTTPSVQSPEVTETANAIGGVATPPAISEQDSAAPVTTEPSEPTPLIASTSVSGAAQHKAPVGAIVIAVLVALALAAVAVVTYMNNDKKEASTSTNAPATSQQTQEVAPSDVDTTNKEIDENLNKADDATDFSDDSLSDTTLNL